MDAVVAYLGLGSNLGRRDENLSTAIRCLNGGPGRGGPGRDGPGRGNKVALAWSIPSKVQVLRASSVYQTSPWGFEDQPDFLNCVVEVRTGLSPQELLEHIKIIENDMGRQPSVRYGPRLIDVDILLYGDAILDLVDLQIPHPRLHQRAFALIPLAELDRRLVHPMFHVTIGELTDRVDGREQVGVWSPPPPVIQEENRTTNT